MFAKVLSVLHDDDFNFTEKDDARRYFLQLRQLFIDLNYTRMEDAEFKTLEERIAAKLAEGKKNA